LKKCEEKMARSILTNGEKEQLQKTTRGLMGCDKDARRSIKRKTLEAMVEDLPLVFEKVTPKEFFEPDYFEPNAYPYRKVFLKNLLIFCYREEYFRLVEERKHKGTKQTIALKDAWKPIKDAIDEAKIELKLKKTE
jgi:hypothetical protein